jgi:NADH:ubiquinone oxidoreductase subunit H
LDGIIEIITQFVAEEPAIFALIIGIIGAAVISGVVNVGAMLVIWGERKVLSDFCNRYGPNRVGGRWGILQLGADAIKLFTKEDIIPADADKGVYVWAPIVASMATMLVAVAIPFGALHINGTD